MTDPLSITAGTAGLISLGIQVVQSLINFYSTYKHQDSNLADTFRNLETLLEVLNILDETLRNREFHPGEERLIHRIDSLIAKSQDVISELKEECLKLSATSLSGSTIARIKAAGHRAAYPFRKSTLTKLEEDVAEIRANLSLALEVLQMRDHEQIQKNSAEIRSVIDLIRHNQISSDITRWLKAPDATISHNAACAKKHSGTGMWLIENQLFKSWMTQPNSFLWLNGFAGCGKSVLLSTAIQYTFRHQQSRSGVAIAFFYFAFNDDSKHDASSMLQAILLQLANQNSSGSEQLAQIYNTYRTGTPPVSSLVDCLKGLISLFTEVYIFLDALDESPWPTARNELLETLDIIRQWKTPALHVLVTSRDLQDIRDDLQPSHQEEIVMRNTGIDDDIVGYIASQLDSDRRLRRWQPFRSHIQTVLAKRAKGVFRWVECQLQSLQSCPHSQSHLDNMLTSLPQSLAETYERILLDIERRGYADDARRILTMLSTSARPLEVFELIDGLAVDINKSPQLNTNRRLHDEDDIRLICPGLIEVDIHVDCDKPYGTVRIAHFSVQEYLMSSRTHQDGLTFFSLSTEAGHLEMAKICLVYLNEPGLSSDTLPPDVEDIYPFACYAAKYWSRHYRRAADHSSKAIDIVIRLFEHSKNYANCVRLYNPDSERLTGPAIEFSLPSGKIPTPLYYAAIYGLEGVCAELLRKEEEKVRLSAVASQQSSEFAKLINARGGRRGTALKAASGRGQLGVVKVLLKHKVDVNIVSGRPGATPLEVASDRGDLELVRLFLQHGAVLDPQNRPGIALPLASFSGNLELVRLLLDHGADVNAQLPQSTPTALRAASEEGHAEVVRLLLDHGADVNAQPSRSHPTALQAASRKGHSEVIKLLLDKGADVNAPGADSTTSESLHSTALQEASENGHQKVVITLLENGADPNAQRNYHGTALHSASRNGHLETMKILLGKGAQVDAQSENSGTILQAASYGDHQACAKLLISWGADVNAQGGVYHKALQAWSAKGHEQVVRLLLDHGADVNAQGGHFSTALQAASAQGHSKVAKILLRHNAEVDIKGGYYGNAVYAASVGGHTEIVEMLLDKKMDLDSCVGCHGTVLAAASYQGRHEVVTLLLSHGAGVNAQAGHYGTALIAASLQGQQETVNLLLTNGAEVNAQVEHYGTALIAASYKNRQEVVKLLLNSGADVNILAGRYGTALIAASVRGNPEIVRILLQNGGSTDAQAPQYGSALQAATWASRQEVVVLVEKDGVEVIALQEDHHELWEEISGMRARAKKLSAGSWSSTCNKFGKVTCLRPGSRHKDVVQILLKSADRGADTRAERNDKQGG